MYLLIFQIQLESISLLLIRIENRSLDIFLSVNSTGTKTIAFALYSKHFFAFAFICCWMMNKNRCLCKNVHVNDAASKKKLSDSVVAQRISSKFHSQFPLFATTSWNSSLSKSFLVSQTHTHTHIRLLRYLSSRAHHESNVMRNENIIISALLLT